LISAIDRLGCEALRCTWARARAMSSRSKKSNSGRARGGAAAAEEELSFGDLDMSAWVDPADAPEDLEKKRAVGGAAAILNGFRKTKTSGACKECSSHARAPC
jgi:hypothetical protein